MRDAGIDIDQDALMRGVSAIMHRKLHGGTGFDNKLGSDELGRKGGMWNFMWRAFMGKNAKLDETSVEDFASRLAAFFGL